MKNTLLIISFLLLLISKIPAQTTVLTEQEKEDLKYLYEEERLANDVYTKLAKKWNSRVFAQIAQSEKRHYTYLLDRLEKYNVEIPKNEIGFYNSSELNDLYDNFTKNGLSSYKEALQVAAQFEEYDIVDLQDAIELTDKKDLKIVYQYLQSGAKRHLEGLYRNIKRRKMSYEPILLSTEEFEEIINRRKDNKHKVGMPFRKI